MPDPRLALLVFAALSLILAGLLWPERGVLPRLLRLWRLGERVRLEDALKHVLTCRQGGQACSLDSLAGHLEISTARAATLLSRLAGMGLVRMAPDGPVLTSEGAQSAIRIVRTHACGSATWPTARASRRPSGTNGPSGWSMPSPPSRPTHSSCGWATRAGTRTAIRSRTPRGRSRRPPASAWPPSNPAARSRSCISRTSPGRSTTPCSERGWYSADASTSWRGPTAAFACGEPAGASGRSTPSRRATSASARCRRASAPRRAGRPCGTPSPARRYASWRSPARARPRNAAGCSTSAWSAARGLRRSW